MLALRSALPEQEEEIPEVYLEKQDYIINKVTKKRLDNWFYCSFILLGSCGNHKQQVPTQYFGLVWFELFFFSFWKLFLRLLCILLKEYLSFVTLLPVNLGFLQLHLWEQSSIWNNAELNSVPFHTRAQNSVKCCLGLQCTCFMSHILCWSKKREVCPWSEPKYNINSICITSGSGEYLHLQVLPFFCYKSLKVSRATRPPLSSVHIITPIFLMHRGASVKCIGVDQNCEQMRKFEHSIARLVFM